MEKEWENTSILILENVFDLTLQMTTADEITPSTQALSNYSEACAKYS